MVALLAVRALVARTTVLLTCTCHNSYLPSVARLPTEVQVPGGHASRARPFCCTPSNESFHRSNARSLRRSRVKLPFQVSNPVVVPLNY